MIKIENHVKRENKLEGNVKNIYVMTFKGFCPSQIKIELNSTLNTTVLLIIP